MSKKISLTENGSSDYIPSSNSSQYNDDKVVSQSGDNYHNLCTENQQNPEQFYLPRK